MEHWDSYDLWEGSRLVGGPTAEKLDALAGTIEEIAVILEETIPSHDRFANDQDWRRGSEKFATGLRLATRRVTSRWPALPRDGGSG